jgi:hypothetical protein
MLSVCSMTREAQKCQAGENSGEVDCEWMRQGHGVTDD